ncbi:hypothetical protein [Sulfurovum sp.]
MNEIITKLPVFEDAETIKAKDAKTKQDNLASLKIAAEEIAALLKSQKK